MLENSSRCVVWSTLTIASPLIVILIVYKTILLVPFFFNTGIPAIIYLTIIVRNGNRTRSNVETLKSSFSYRSVQRSEEGIVYADLSPHKDCLEKIRFHSITYKILT